MAPKRLPWSVRARAGNRSSLARWTSFSSWAAPSSRLYSEWTWRWTNSARCISRALFPLDGRRRLGGDVEHHPVHALDLVDDPVGHAAEKIIGQAGPVGGHGVL